MGTRKKRINTEAAQNDFLEALMAGATVTDAAKAAGVSPATVYRWRSAGKKFAEDWKGAYEYGADALELEAQRRAVEGVEQTVYHQGRPCGTTRSYSDTLLIFLMKARNPRKFCDRARMAELLRAWAKADDDEKNEDTRGFAEAKAAAVAALDRLAAEKAALAKNVIRVC